jgi:hypothetical protein
MPLQDQPPGPPAANFAPRDRSTHSSSSPGAEATTRAFRIGQQKNVVVHNFIVQGTIEEKIDAMLEEKARLSGEVIVSGGEGWITELDNDQLLDLFRLSLSKTAVSRRRHRSPRSRAGFGA